METDIPLLSFAADPSARPGAVHDESSAFVHINLERVIEDGVGFLDYGGPGSGKSHLLRFLCEETFGRVHHIILDTEGEFHTLREHFPYLLASAGGDGDLPLSVATAGVLCEKIMELRIPTILDISEMRLEDRPRFVAAFLNQLVETPSDQWHPVLVFVDEVQRYAPQQESSVSKSAVANVPAVGRKRGIMAVLATQNTEQVDKNTVSLLPNKMVGMITQDNRRRRAALDFDLSTEERELLKTMQRGQFFVQGPAFGNVTRLVRIPDTLTRKPKHGIARSAPPPTPEAIQAILEHFAGMPEAAAEEAETLTEAKRQIASLRKQLTERPMETRTVEVEKTVEVPVLSPDTIEQIRHSIDAASGVAKELGSLVTLLQAVVDRPLFNSPTFSGRTKEEVAVQSLPSEPETRGKSAETARTISEPAAVQPEPEASPSVQEPGNPPPVIRYIAEQTPRVPGTAYPAGAMRILTALAPGQRLTPAQLGTRSKLAISGGAATGYLNRLRADALISYENGFYTITERGLQAMGLTRAAAPQTTEEVLKLWEDALSNRSYDMLVLLVEATKQEKGLTPEQIAAKMGISASGGAFGGYRTELTQNNLAEKRGRLLFASDGLFPERQE